MRLPEDNSGARNDDHLVELWLHGRPENTKRAYLRVARNFLAFCLALSTPVTLRDVTVAILVEWVKTLKGKPSTLAHKISTIKSLFSYAHKTGYLVFNVGVALRVPKVPNRLHERIVEEEIMREILEVQGSDRDTTLVRFLYVSGVRISEAMNLNFIDIKPGRVTVVLGKGTKSRTVVVPVAITDMLQGLRQPGDKPDSPVFKNRRGNRLSTRGARKIVASMTDEAGNQISPHYFRHAHASHSLDRGAPIHLVQHSLGHANVATTSRYLHVRPDQGASQFLSI